MRSYIKQAIPALLVLVPLVGWSAPEFSPVKEPAVRIESAGFSILPPAGSNWHMRKIDNGWVFARQGSPGSHTHTVGAAIMRHTGFNPGSVGFAAYATNPEVFAAYVKKATEAMNPPGSRMRFLDHTVVPDSRLGYCAREYAKFEDRGSPVTAAVLTQEDWSYTCLHPSSPQVIIQVSFSERGLPGETDPSLPSIREQFWESLEFRPLP
jgi:hypothetical protein